MSKTDLKLSAATPKRSIVLAVLLALVAAFSLIALVDYEPQFVHQSPQISDSPVLGKTGVFIGRCFNGWFGLSSWLLPWFFLNLSIASFKQTTSSVKLTQFLSTLSCILFVSILSNVTDHSNLASSNDSVFENDFYEHGAGGSLGAFLYSGMPFVESVNNAFENSGPLKTWLGSVGTILLSLIGLMLGLFYHIRWYFKLSNPLSKLNELVSSMKSMKKSREEDTLDDDAEDNNLEKSESNQNKSKKWGFGFFNSKDEEDLLFEDVSLQKSDPSIKNLPINEPATSSKSANKKIKFQDEEDLLNPINEKAVFPNLLDVAKEESVAIRDTSSSEENTLEQPEVEMDGFKVVRAAKTEKAGDLFPEHKGDYHFPTLELLMEPPEEESYEDEDHMIKARNLKETLAQFKVEIELGEVHTGPVITRYDVHPAAGVRVEKIANLDKNLAMALKADSVRILAPVPGKGCVGIEVPNQKPAPVCLKEILQSKAWADAGAEIPIVLGKEASGRALVADLTKMPHLLVAGSTGSGKTVCINAIIASLCYHSSPEDVRFIMVDPKIVEMKVYNDLPHMLIPVVTEPKKVPSALKWLLVEMERRYQIFSKVGVRNIAGFNAKILKDKEEKEKAQLLDAQMTAEERAALSSIEVPRDDDVLEIPENKLPYIVCIIDELADLMMVAQADVETGIARLAQLARAAGIHLIIATQRPSVNVITGVIKANLPSRISFRVASYRDSQTILDGKGAEALIGKGDMLFIPPGSSTFLRAQGAFVSDEEINGIVDYLKINGPPQIIEEVREQIDSAGEDDVLGDGDDSDEDPMIRRAIEVIRSTKRASTSNLQRKLSIGYNRAARIMDDLEDRGLIGPDVPGQGREILMDL
ncbi:MAG: DNA translocase FtsK [Verrucomicrobiota bacterium]|nr:DNA translocase FtsK [Verrucomicrobiota bacterium]